MKIKTRLDDSGMLESDEWFQMNHWLAELRDDGQAESRDDGHREGQDDGRAEGQGDGRAELQDDGGYAEPRDDGRAELQDDGGYAEPQDGRRAEPPDEGYAEPRDDGRAEPWDDGGARSPRHGYSWPADLTAAPADGPRARAETTVRAVIGDQLRIPIMWCEISSCISWYAHPAALGEADVRARAISAGWRVDAVGLLACPQCQQTAPGFQSPRPVALWDRAEASSQAARMATEPSDDAVASAARELSHDLRRPGAEKAAAVPWEVSHDLRRPAGGDEAVGSVRWEAGYDPHRPDDSRRPAGPQQPGRHRKRFAARILRARLQTG